MVVLKNVSFPGFVRRSSRESDQELRLFTHAAHRRVHALVTVGVGARLNPLRPPGGGHLVHLASFSPGYLCSITHQPSSWPLTVPPAAPDPVLFTRGSCLGSRLQNYRMKPGTHKCRCLYLHVRLLQIQSRLQFLCESNVQCLSNVVVFGKTCKSAPDSPEPRPPGALRRLLVVTQGNFSKNECFVFTQVVDQLLIRLKPRLEFTSQCLNRLLFYFSNFTICFSTSVQTGSLLFTSYVTALTLKRK